MTETSWIEVGASTLSPLCAAVGLNADPDVGAPPGVSLWCSGYAAVAFWPVALEAFAANAGEAETWFADYLYGQERRRNARVVDGYLLLAFEKPVPETHYGAIRAVELSTEVCRKHAVWPEDDGAWCRFDAVTVLGLPKALTSTSGEPKWPTLEGEAAALWARIQKSGPKRVADLEGRRA